MKWLTAKELDFLRANYRRLGGAACAAALGRSLFSIRGMLRRVGIRMPGRKVNIRWTDAIDANIRELNAAGYSDADISIEVRASHSALKRRRRMLGLSGQKDSPRHRAKTRAAWLATLERYGVQPGDCLRTLIERVEAAK